jgi:C-terminal processing protease CtpA/Prc
MFKYNLLSLSIHILLLVTISFHIANGGGNGNSDVEGKGNKKQGQKEEGQGTGISGIEVNVIERPQPIKVVEKSKEKLKQEQEQAELILKREQLEKLIDQDCPGEWYGGIGIEISNGRITRVFRGYSAELSGIKEGDILISTNSQDILGEPGTTVRLTILRGEDGNSKIIEVVRVKVCY